MTQFDGPAGHAHPVAPTCPTCGSGSTIRRKDVNTIVAGRWHYCLDRFHSPVVEEDRWETLREALERLRDTAPDLRTEAQANGYGLWVRSVARAVLQPHTEEEEE